MLKITTKTNKTEIIKYLIGLFLNIISIVLTLVMCTNYTYVLAHLGIEKFQIKYADQCRTNYDITNALDYYGIIGAHDSKYAPYANLACAQIHNEQQNYEKALEFYKKAIVSDDISVLSSCMDFAINQINDYTKGNNETVNFYNDENIVFVVDLMNRINEISPDIFEYTNIKFPMDSGSVLEYLFQDKTIKWSTYNWKYDYTKVTDEAGLEYVSETDKLVSVDSWQERIDPNGAAVVTLYKYFHYNKIESTKELSAKEFFNHIMPKQEKIYLSQLDLDDD